MTNEIGMIRPGADPLSATRNSPAAATRKAVSPASTEGAVPANVQAPQTSEAQPAAESVATRAARQAEEVSRRKAEAEQLAEEVAAGLNDLVQELHRELQFSVDKDSGDTVIKVVDRQTDEILRQIPSEEMLHLRKRLAEVAGVIFQDSA